MRTERAVLGAALRAAREDAGVTTRQVADYSSAHISQVENGKVLPSEDLVRAYITLGGDAGRLLGLLDRARALRGQATGPEVAGELASPRSDPYLLRRGYTIEHVSDLHRFGTDRRLLAISHRARVHRLHDGSRFFPIRYSYTDDPRPGVATIRGLESCEIAYQEEDATGVLYAVIDFADAATDEVGAADLVWTITVDSDVPSRSKVSAGTSARLPSATIAAEFADDCVPSDVRPFRDVDERATPPEAYGGSRGRRSSAHEHRFADLEREWWGLVWTWPTS